jgi:hypothetical protein
MRGYVHVKAHQLLVFSFAWIQTDNGIARKPLDRKAVRRVAGPVSRARREDADAVGVRERSGLDNVKGHMLDLRESTEAGREDVVHELLETAERAGIGIGGPLDGREDPLRQRAVVYRFCDVVALRCGAQVVRDVHADLHGLPHWCGRRGGPLGTVRDVCEKLQVADSDGVLVMLRTLRVRGTRCILFGGGGHRRSCSSPLFFGPTCSVPPSS